MLVYSHRNRNCVSGCCSPQLHKIPVLVDRNSLDLQVLPCRGSRGVAAAKVSPAVTAVHRAPSLAGDTSVLLWALLPWPCCPLLSGQADLPGGFPCVQTSNGKLELMHLLKKGTFTSTGYLRPAISDSSLGDP